MFYCLVCVVIGVGGLVGVFGDLLDCCFYVVEGVVDLFGIVGLVFDFGV